MPEISKVSGATGETVGGRYYEPFDNYENFVTSLEEVEVGRRDENANQRLTISSPDFSL